MGIYPESKNSDFDYLFNGPLASLTDSDSSEDEMMDTPRPVRTDLEDGEIEEPRTESKVGSITLQF